MLTPVHLLYVEDDSECIEIIAEFAGTKELSVPIL
jgi:hypothetical protein